MHKTTPLLVSCEGMQQYGDVWNECYESEVGEVDLIVVFQQYCQNMKQQYNNFRRLFKISKANINFVMSVRPHGTTRLPL